jgi:tRNA-dihydrouridine synthase A
MMEISDRHWRAMLRRITRRTVLYTEMVVDDIVLHNTDDGGLDFFLGTGIEENPSVIQLGGHDVDTLAEAAELVSRYGDYSEINLNCGCPSQRVAQRCFGAKLMEEPDHVRQIVHAMTRVSSLPVTVKCRIGVDKQDSYEELCTFIAAVKQGGCDKFVVHARKCLLRGLSTKQNRDVPPLKYDVVHRLVGDFPDIRFVLNGGVLTLSDAASHLAGDQPNPVHGVMIGRAVYNNPLLLATADSTFFGLRDSCVSRRRVAESYMDYCEWAQGEAGPARVSSRGKRQQATTAILLKPVHNLMVGLQHNSQYKVVLNDAYVSRVREGDANPPPRAIIEEALAVLRDEDLDAPLGNNERHDLDLGSTTDCDGLA